MKRETDATGNGMKQNSGRVLVETLASMFLLILLGAGCFSLAMSAIGAYNRLYASKENASELRIAYSFVTTKIRQYDISGCLEVKPDAVSGKNALVIHEKIDDMVYDTWIFHYDGYLYEAIVLENEDPEVDISQPIARIDSFDIRYDEGAHGFFIKAGIEGHKTYGGFLKLRSR